MIAISVLGVPSLSKQLLDSLTKPNSKSFSLFSFTSRHVFGCVENHVSLYPFPYFDVHTDLAIFDFSSISIDLIIQNV